MTDELMKIEREEEPIMDGGRVLSAYAAYSLDESERAKSSSGGIFSLLAANVLKNGGVVYGVAMSADCRRAEFIKATDEADIDKLRTSKYLQAHIGDSFSRVKEDLENGLPVLFSGTGCQINGLIGFLGAGKDVSTVKKQYPNLYCLDVICHGAPSPALWRKYVSYIEKENSAKLVGINFRCKDDSWVDFGMKEIHTREDADDKIQKELYISKDKDSYMLMFLRDYCLRPSCYECKAKDTKLSDITLADFWGIERVALEMSDGKGISLILVRTEQGAKLLQKILESMKMKEVSYEEAVAGNKAEYKSALRPAQRNTFFEDMKTLSFEDLKKKYGMPTSPSLKRKIESGVRRILIRVGVIQGRIGIIHSMDYCLCFVLRAEYTN